MRDKYNLNTLPPGHEEEYGNLGELMDVFFLATISGISSPDPVLISQLQVMPLWRESLEVEALSSLVSPFQVCLVECNQFPLAMNSCIR